MAFSASFSGRQRCLMSNAKVEKGFLRLAQRDWSCLSEEDCHLLLEFQQSNFVKVREECCLYFLGVV